MPKIGMRALRRSQLVDATVALVRQRGIAGASVSEISAKAGLATGMVHHYFAYKNALLEATMWELLRRMSRHLFALLAEARTPMERVLAFVDGNLSPLSMTPENVSVWLSFWGEVPHNPRLARIHNIVARRTQGALARALASYMSHEDAVRNAKAIAVFVDGLWLRAAVDAEGMTPEQAKQIAYEFLRRQLGVVPGTPVGAKPLRAPRRTQKKGTPVRR